MTPYKFHPDALKEADYLIVTDPYELLTSGYNSPPAEVNKLLSDMAELAWWKWGALGYINSGADMFAPSFDASTLHNLIKPLPPFIGCINCIKGQWAKKLHPNFSKPLGGYLLLVGSLPCWTA